MNQQEIDYIAQTLMQILDNDNIIRKQGEEKLLQIKSQEPDKYAAYLVSILQQRKSVTICKARSLTYFPFL